MKYKADIRRFYSLLHYWKIRCKERQTLHSKELLVSQRLNRLEKLEKGLAKTLNRKLMVVNKEDKSPQYPLYLSHIQAVRLRQLLDKPWHYKYVTRTKGKTTIKLTKREYERLKNLLKIK